MLWDLHHGWRYSCSRSVDGVRPDRAADQALALAPSNINMLQEKITAYLGQGDLPGAQATLRAASRAVEPSDPPRQSGVFRTSAGCWTAPSRRLLLHLPPAAFDDDRGTRALAFAETYALRGDQARVRLYADSARLGSEEEFRHSPQNAGPTPYEELHSPTWIDGLELFGRGSAVSHSTRRTASVAPTTSTCLARIYVLVGQPEKALDRIEALLKIPYPLSPAWLRIDPTFAPLRGNPRFEQLVATKEMSGR